MTDLLLEIGCEEIPASYLDQALTWLSETAKTELEKARLSFDSVETKGTPRRIVLVVYNLSEKQTELTTEVLGPRAESAFDDAGNLTKQAIGFLSAKSIDPADAYRKTTIKGDVLAAKVFEKGKHVQDLLPEILEGLIKTMPFPKVMRWEQSGALFARPIRWLLSLYGTEPISIQFADVISGSQTTGHRFLSPEWENIKDLGHYLELMPKKFVMLSPEERRRVILEKATELASAQGGFLVHDEPLLDVVKNLVEYPWPLLGTFEERYLAIPKEILISEMREHQKYFAIQDKNGKLLASFVVVAGSLSKNPKSVADGHARVLRARFEDGAFYYEEDIKYPIEKFNERLKTVQFQRELGSVFDKVCRIEKLSAKIAEQLKCDEKSSLFGQRIAHLSKADLVSGVVSQFPELQGVMGSYYAAKSGEPEEVAVGILEHYLPKFSKDSIPTTTQGCIVAIADKLDTLVGIIGIGKAPKGNTDPFALRRAAIGISRIVIEKGFAVSMPKLVSDAAATYEDKLTISDELQAEILSFILARARGLFSAPVTIVDGAIAVGAEDFSDLAARIEAISQLQEEDPDAFLGLAAGLKRASNIVTKAKADGMFNESTKINPSLFEAESEKALHSNLEIVLAKIEGSALKDSKEELQKLYFEVMREIAALKPHVDKFFDEVMVMVDNAALRGTRLSLLSNLQKATNTIADFSRIQL